MWTEGSKYLSISKPFGFSKSPPFTSFLRYACISFLRWKDERSQNYTFLSIAAMSHNKQTKKCRKRATCRNLGTGTLFRIFLILLLPISFSATFTFSSASSTACRTTSMNCWKKTKKHNNNWHKNYLPIHLS